MHLLLKNVKYMSYSKTTYSFNIRVRYADTDQMGYVYYGKYAEYFEVARVEALRSVGLSYKKVEENGLMLPVYEYNVKYIAPVFYDDNLEIRSTIELLSDSRIAFEHEVYVDDKVKTKARVVLVGIDPVKKRPINIPSEIKDLLNI